VLCVCSCVVVEGLDRRWEDPPEFKRNYCFYRLVCLFAHTCTLLEDGSRMPEANTIVFLTW
jgi:hypothetical protein